jgi:pyruvate/2-oxoglutarate dehydrogenase complex dihydrolipoamide acyltransferase (E2) component
MAIEKIHMPKVSQEMDEVTLTRWAVAPGDRVNKGDVLCSVETEKASVDVESEQEGVVRALLVPEGSLVKLFTEIAEIETA